MYQSSHVSKDVHVTERNHYNANQSAPAIATMPLPLPPFPLSTNKTQQRIEGLVWRISTSQR